MSLPVQRSDQLNPSNLRSILRNFCIEGKPAAISRIGSGHINDSYLVTTTHAEYVLQRINHTIFRNVPELTNNILKVTSHLKEKLLNQPVGLNSFCITQLIPTGKGEYFFQDHGGNFWRLYTCISGTKSYDIIENPQLAYEGGKAFGIFQYLTSDIDPDALYEILPNFHNIETRLSDFREIVKRDPAGRVKDVQREIFFIEERAVEMHTILNLGQQKKITLRITHNDTKFNNILFNENNRAISIVDLDTVMPGYLLYDFGDAIRTGANMAAEDEEDLSKVGIDLGLFKAYSTGYLEIARKFLCPAEIDHLAFSAKFMTYIIGLRFLTDHLDGDHYYRIHFPGHNLQRAKSQFKLLKDMDLNFSSMKEIIRGCCL